jgi:hypothetical protein
MRVFKFWQRLVALADDRSDDARPVWREVSGSHSPYSPLALSRYGCNPFWKSEPPCRFWLGALSIYRRSEAKIQWSFLHRALLGFKLHIPSNALLFLLQAFLATSNLLPSGSRASQNRHSKRE